MAIDTAPAPIAPQGFSSDSVVKSEERLSAWRTDLVAQGRSGTLGYLGEVPREQWQVDSKSVENYYLAQFALAPLILDADNVHHEWIVADLPRARLSARAPSGWAVVDDGRDGPILLKKESR